MSLGICPRLVNIHKKLTAATTMAEGHDQPTADHNTITRHMLRQNDQLLQEAPTT